ncbi:hypothetical protein EDB86DRAFT_3088763 [Lactarius hatsudake]|nr:hypothetical protein EDB86DRAFT_3088763 [Lactarius hatsudake]
MLHLIPALESLVFTFLPDEESWMKPLTYDNKLSRCQLLQLHVLEGLACNPNPLPALHSLQIDDWFAYPNEYYATAPFQRIVASLRDLRFLVQDTDYNHDLDHFLAEDFWADVVVPEAEDFIVRHGKTLKKLELRDCAICVPRDMPTPLVDLVEYNYNQRYVHFFPVCGFGSAPAFLRGTEQDIPALEALFAIVGGRKGLNVDDNGD